MIIDITGIQEIADSKNVTMREVYKKAGFKFLLYWRHTTGKAKPELETLNKLYNAVNSL